MESFKEKINIRSMYIFCIYFSSPGGDSVDSPGICNQEHVGVPGTVERELQVRYEAYNQKYFGISVTVEREVLEI